VKKRKAKFDRKSKETEIKTALNLDGRGKTKIKTNIGLLDHMLELAFFHGLFDVDVAVKKADLQIDIHHTNEDVGIVLGKTFQKALGDKKGIRRFGFGAAPMEATVAHCVIDISGRGYFKLEMNTLPPAMKEKDGYALAHMEHFMESFALNLGANINIRLFNPCDDIHTNVEAVFKSFGLALDAATRIDPRRSGIPSTKGIID